MTVQAFEASTERVSILRDKISYTLHFGSPSTDLSGLLYQDAAEICLGSLPPAPRLFGPCSTASVVIHSFGKSLLSPLPNILTSSLSPALCSDGLYRGSCFTHRCVARVTGTAVKSKYS